MFFFCSQLSKQAIKDYNRGRIYLTDLAKRKQIPVFENITEAVNSAISKCEKRWKLRLFIVKAYIIIIIICCLCMCGDFLFCIFHCWCCSSGSSDSSLSQSIRSLTHTLYSSLQRIPKRKKITLFYTQFYLFCKSCIYM